MLAPPNAESNYCMMLGPNRLVDTVTADFAALSAEFSSRGVGQGRWCAATFVVGADFSFGKTAPATSGVLATSAKAWVMDCRWVPPGSRPMELVWLATKIREFGSGRRLGAPCLLLGRAVRDRWHRRAWRWPGRNLGGSDRERGNEGENPTQARRFTLAGQAALEGTLRHGFLRLQSVS